MGLYWIGTGQGEFSMYGNTNQNTAVIKGALSSYNDKK